MFASGVGLFAFAQEVLDASEQNRLTRLYMPRKSSDGWFSACSSLPAQFVVLERIARLRSSCAVPTGLFGKGWDRNPTLKGGASLRCAYGAGAGDCKCNRNPTLKGGANLHSASGAGAGDCKCNRYPHLERWG